MPRKDRAKIARHSRHTTNQRNYTARRTKEGNATVRESARIEITEYYARSSQELHEARNEQQRLRKRQVPARKIHEVGEQHLPAQRER